MLPQGILATKPWSTLASSYEINVQQTPFGKYVDPGFVDLSALAQAAIAPHLQISFR